TTSQAEPGITRTRPNPVYPAVRQVEAQGDFAKLEETVVLGVHACGLGPVHPHPPRALGFTGLARWIRARVTVVRRVEAEIVFRHGAVIDETALLVEPEEVQIQRLELDVVREVGLVPRRAVAQDHWADARTDNLGAQVTLSGIGNPHRVGQAGERVTS